MTLNVCCGSGEVEKSSERYLLALTGMAFQYPFIIMFCQDKFEVPVKVSEN